MKFAQCDYDKPHRCPGWSGAGWRYNKQDWCDSTVPEGQFRWAWRGENSGFGPFWFLRIRRTNCCGTYVLPHVLVWFNWRTWWPLRAPWYPCMRLKRAIGEISLFRYRRQVRREQR